MHHLKYFAEVNLNYHKNKIDIICFHLIDEEDKVQGNKKFAQFHFC